MVDLVNLLRSIAFGPFVAFGFLCGAFVFWKKGKEEYYDEYALFDVLLASSFWGLLGARAGFILAHIQDFGLDFIKWLSVFTYPGYVGLAGFVVGAYVLFTYAKKQHWDAFELADFGAMGLSLASVLFAIGMFVNGSGFGNPTRLPVGMQFPGVFDNRHPSQLYAATLYLVLFIVLWKLERVYRTFLWYRENRRTVQTGFIFAAFCIGYGLIGVALGLTRQASMTVFGIPIDPFLFAISIIAGFSILYVRSGRILPFAKRKSALPQSV